LSVSAERRFFHFAIAWPEVFAPPQEGFDVVIGNPPYLGGMKISTTFGEEVHKFLKSLSE
jgi:methylase of polypeptide subunit release factors